MSPASKTVSLPHRSGVSFRIEPTEPSRVGTAAFNAPVRTALIFDSFGPYHMARLAAARAKMDVVGIEICGRSDDYSWYASTSHDAKITLFPEASYSAIRRRDLARQLDACLDERDPEVVAVPGWSMPSALFAMDWAARRRRPVVMMCDSTERDARRYVLLEKLKSVILSGCGAALVSGTRSRQYLEKLGMPPHHVHLGYDVVDNAFFSSGATLARQQAAGNRFALGLPERYFLCVCRLIRKKNLARLIAAYAKYTRSKASGEVLSLVIAGDGEQKAELQALSQQLGVADTIVFMGRVPYEKLPACYGLATAFIMPSTVEQWGLVVNEAVASGLPVVVSHRCGAAEDLVRDGENGFLFDPTSIESVASALSRIADRSDLTQMSQASCGLAEQ